MDYINLLHASGIYEKQTAKIIPFRSIDIFENAVSAGTGSFLVDGPKETVRIDESILPEDTTFGHSMKSIHLSRLEKMTA